MFDGYICANNIPRPGTKVTVHVGNGMRKEIEIVHTVISVGDPKVYMLGEHGEGADILVRIRDAVDHTTWVTLKNLEESAYKPQNNRGFVAQPKEVLTTVNVLKMISK